MNGGTFAEPRVELSDDPLVNYRWPAPKADDGLQVYQLRPRTVEADRPEAFGNLESITTSACNVAVNGVGSIRVDFGVESPAWLEFDSPDFSGSVELSISEYNHPGKVNPGPAHPDKTLAPKRYGNTFRLELNADLYEGVRFGWIHVRDYVRTWHITAVRAVCQAKPTNYNGRFACSDPVLTRIWYAGAYSARVGFQRDYMGAILMDRSDRFGWSGDCNPIQAAALVAFGNADFVKSNLARTANDNQGIELYSLYWVLSLMEYYRHTGDSETLRSYLGNVQGKLDHANQLYATPQSAFFGWDERLGAGFEAPNRPETASIYRSMFLQGCREFADAMNSINRGDIAGIYQSIADQRDTELHADANWFRPLGVHARAHAVNARRVRADERQAVVADEFTDRLNRLSFSTFNQYPILQAMTRLDRCDDALVTARDNWGGQLDYGGTTFFEVFRPDWLNFLKPNDPPPNGQSGWTSLSHPWGGGVTAWLSHDILGITPSSPGYATVDIFPRPGRTLTWLSGTVPTPRGDVSVDYDILSGSGSFQIPGGSKGRFRIPSDGRAVTSAQINGQVVWDGTFKPVAGVGGASADQDSVVLTDIAAGDYRLNVTYQGSRGPAYQPEPFAYPMRFHSRDLTTAGDWGQVYGRDGYVLFNYDGKGQHRSALPPYVTSVAPWRTGWGSSLDGVWQSGTSDRRAPASDPNNGAVRNAACIYTATPQPAGMSMPLDVVVAPGTTYQLALYFVDWDSATRRLAVEVFDLATRKLVAPEQLVDDFHGGTWLVYECDRSVRVRLAHVLGDNAVLSGIFFDPVQGAAPRPNTFYAVKRNQSGTWTAWSTPAGSGGYSTFDGEQEAITSMPDKSGDTQLLGRGRDGNIYHALHRDADPWSTLSWAAMAGAGGAPTFSGPSMAIAGLPDSSSQVIAMGLDGYMWHNIRYPNGSWQGWHQIPGQTGSIRPGIVGKIAIAGLPNGDTQIVGSTSNGAIYHNIRHGGSSPSWSGWTAAPGIPTTGGNANYSLGITAKSDNTTQLVTVGPDGNVWFNTRGSGDNGSWGAWQRLAGVGGSSPYMAATDVAISFIPDGSNTTQVIVTGAGNTLYHNLRNNNTNTWQSIGFAAPAGINGSSAFKSNKVGIAGLQSGGAQILATAG